jgi:pyrroloquinoline-quinone synthase
MEAAQFREAMLGVMERKVHWAWPAFTSGMVPAPLLHVHLEQEYATYVRDFPLLIGRAYAQCPLPAVRRELAENLYEEETGGIIAGRPHPELFLEYPRGLGMDLSRFERVQLLPAAAAFRGALDDATIARGWEVAAAVTTIFLEGTANERAEIDPSAPKRAPSRLSEHPLVKHYGLPVEHLALTKAHRQVEGDHRAAAWRVMLDHVAADKRGAVLAWMDDVLAAWQRYRDEVALACGIARGADGAPTRKP